MVCPTSTVGFNKQGLLPTRSNPGYFEGRKAVYIPDLERYKNEWEKMGIERIESAYGNRHLANALLPEGWELRYNFAFRRFAIFDRDGFPKVVMPIGIKSNPDTDFTLPPRPTDTVLGAYVVESQKWGVVTPVFFNPDNPVFKWAQEDEGARNDVFSVRSERWSEKHIFALLYYYPVYKDYKLGPLWVDSKTNFAQGEQLCGFFSTEEEAKKAQSLLQNRRQTGRFMITPCGVERPELRSMLPAFHPVNPFI